MAEVKGGGSRDARPRLYVTIVEIGSAYDSKRSFAHNFPVISCGPASMRRHLLGIIGIFLILAGLISSFVESGSVRDFGFIPSSCIRVGIVLAALWLAFPQILELSNRVPAWLFGAILLGCVVVAVRPRTIALIAPLIAALFGMHLMGLVLRSPLPKTRPRKMGPKNRDADSRPS
jgi:hypothetical protein